ncbi:uncharacterized protein LOC125476538 [Pyrus x bretschneideri]|uniref:uncharacterized protein LOC125476538 n=1 Tax=Pyrus x bretschneideri TaxID=225117 RepID=UPI00202E7BA4|nr:uncharacterized protein LOC125476538 [Pyrus x bretschneideri]
MVVPTAMDLSPSNQTPLLPFLLSNLPFIISDSLSSVTLIPLPAWGKPPPFSESEALLRQHIQWSQQNWIVGPAKPSIKALAVRLGVDQWRREGLRCRLSGESVVYSGAVEDWGIGGGVLERLGVDKGVESQGGESGVVAQVTVVQVC